MSPEFRDSQRVVEWLGCQSLIPAWSRDLHRQVCGQGTGSLRGFGDLLLFLLQVHSHPSVCHELVMGKEEFGVLDFLILSVPHAVFLP